MKNQNNIFENKLVSYLIKIISTLSIFYMTYYIFYENLYKNRNQSNEVVMENIINSDTANVNLDTTLQKDSIQINYNTNDTAFYSTKNLISIQNLDLSSDSLFNIRQSILRDIPTPNSLVKDYVNILNFSQLDSLEQLLNYYNNEKGIQIAVVTIFPFMYDNIDNFSTNLANKWGIGSKETNYGILFTYDLIGRKVRITNGYGIEKIYTNKETEAIIEKIIKPNFKENKIFEGIFYAANQMAGEILSKSNFKKIKELNKKN